MEAPYMYGRYVVMPPPPPALSKGDFYYQQYIPPTNGSSPVTVSQPTLLHGSTLRGCYQNASGWTGVPLISNVARRPKKQTGVNPNAPKGTGGTTLTQRLHSSLRHVIDYDENAMSRLVVHTQGVPLTQTNGRSRPKIKKPQITSDDRSDASKDPADYLKKLENGHGNNNNNNNYKNNNGDGEQLSYGSCSNLFNVFNVNDSSGNASQQNQMVTSLPRIIKPRKRRKKERKPANCNASTSESRDASGQRNKYTDINSNHIGGENLTKLPAERHFNRRNDVQPNSEPANGVGNNMADTISCSCRICDPFCKIWAFPLKKTCSDATAESASLTTELVIETMPNPDVGVIGSHRVSGARNEWRTSLGLSPSNSSLDSKFSGEIVTRKSSFSDSGDSGCDILGGLNLSTDFLTNMDDLSVIDSPMPTANIYSFVDSAFVDAVNDLSNDMINGMQFKCDFLPPAECLINVNNIFESDNGTNKT